MGYEKLKNTKAEFISDYPRINGYYYSMDNTDSSQYVHLMFFYKNGVLYHPAWVKISNESNLEKEYFEFMLKHNVFETDKEIAYVWGIYFVKGDKINTEEWVWGTGWKHPTVESSYTILNDTTIQWDYKERIYHFREYSTKPDSTNQFTN